MTLTKILKDRGLSRMFILMAAMLLSAFCVRAQPPGGGFPGGRPPGGFPGGHPPGDRGNWNPQSQQPPHHHWLIHHSSDGHCRTEYSLMLSKLDSNVNFGQLVYFLTKFIIQCMYSVQFSLSAASNSL